MFKRRFVIKNRSKIGTRLKYLRTVGRQVLYEHRDELHSLYNRELSVRSCSKNDPYRGPDSISLCYLRISLLNSSLHYFKYKLLSIHLYLIFSSGRGGTFAFFFSRDPSDRFLFCIEDTHL